MKRSKPKGTLTGWDVFTDKLTADQAAARIRVSDRRGDGKRASVRLHHRQVRADGLRVDVYVLVRREAVKS